MLYKLLVDVPWMCDWAPGQETPAACPSCSSAAPQCCSHAGSASWGHKPREFQGAPTKGCQALLNSPCSYSQGALRQTTAAAPALMIEETENNHTRITTPSPSYWICSCSSSTNAKFLPHWVLSGLFSPLGFAASSFSIPLPLLLLLWAPGEHLQCQGLLL